MGRVAIFGDIGGHASELAAHLVALGADPATLQLPEDLTVIQLGDLVHRGPDSPGVIAIVDTALTRQPRQWVQLAGNHEADQYVHEPRFMWPERLPEADQARIRDWWDAGMLRAAAAVRTGLGQQFLITHAGLTATLWDRLGRPATAAATADAVNAWTPEDPNLWRAGTMLLGVTDWLAGPFWAEAGTEVYASWAEHAAAASLPFSQVHGHSSIIDWDRSTARPTPARVLEAASVDVARRHVRVDLPGGQLIGVDAGHGSVAAPSWGPLVLPNATVLAR